MLKQLILILEYFLADGTSLRAVRVLILLFVKTDMPVEGTHFLHSDNL